VESTWEVRDLPVLDAVMRYYEAQPGQPGPRVADIAEAMGRDPTDVYRALKAMDPTYVRLQGGPGRGVSGSMVRGITDEARRAVDSGDPV
jgi:hypothetical protein